ncbi:MAG: hypothetical protein KDK23_16340, partial [Leptospiraceae bacterium]|nr:hypothetical protein [Leptospiraceae bacterium]
MCTVGFSIQTAIQAGCVISFVLALGLLQASHKASRISFVRYWSAGLGLVCLRYLAWMLEPIIGNPASQFAGEMAHTMSMYLIFF